MDYMFMKGKCQNPQVLSNLFHTPVSKLCQKYGILVAEIDHSISLRFLLCQMLPNRWSNSLGCLSITASKKIKFLLYGGTDKQRKLQNIFLVDQALKVSYNRPVKLFFPTNERTYRRTALIIEQPIYFDTDMNEENILVVCRLRSFSKVGQVK